MRVAMFADYFIIERGSEGHESFFAFFVDADKSSWTRYMPSAQRYNSPASAKVGIEWIKQRERARRSKARKSE